MPALTDERLKALLQRIEMAVNKLLCENPSLLDYEAHEQAISHRIAVYLELEFPGFNVDCEYNKRLEETKRVTLTDVGFRECTCASCSDRTRRNTRYSNNISFRPDIVVHKRGTDSGNLVVVEIKKRDKCLFDQAKLKALTASSGDYHYQIGVFLRFPDNRPEYLVYADGVEVSA